ncbi:MAG: hypothetical protein ACOX5M_02555 [Bacillota bacterium]|jgi:hypothetical protein
MKKRLQAIAVPALCVLLFLSAASCSAPRSPQKLDVGETKLIAWDALQPDFPGSPDYEADVSKIIEEFSRETGVAVELKWAERSEALAVLVGTADADTRPHLMFSSEWPVIADVVADISGELERDTFIDPAITYWSRDEQVFGIPAYIQWIGTAARTLPVGDGTTAYWVDSPAFLRAALDRGEAGWNEETLLEYAQWVKGKYGRFRDDPLLAWQQGAVDALYPVTPYLFKWLKTSAQGTEAEISVVPASSPFGSDSFYYTVPAYLVLAENAPEKAAAVELGKRLSANLGRWAARTLGCVPASVIDVPIFNLDSGFEYEERQVIWESVSPGLLTAPDAQDFIRTSSIAGVLLPTLEDFLRGEVSSESLEESIRSACLRHTRP